MPSPRPQGRVHGVPREAMSPIPLSGLSSTLVNTEPGRDTSHGHRYTLGGRQPLSPGGGQPGRNLHADPRWAAFRAQDGRSEEQIRKIEI